MRKIKNSTKIFPLLLIITSALILTACDPMALLAKLEARVYGEGLAPIEAVPVTGVTLNTSAITLLGRSAEQLAATVEPADATIQEVTWSSSNAAVAAVSEEGLVRGGDPGAAIITVTTADGGFTAFCTVTVEAVAVTGVSLNKDSTSLVMTDSEQLKATIVPANATNQNVNWSSTDDSKATVNASGTVTGLVLGSAAIIVSTVDGGFTDNCTVTVEPKMEISGIGGTAGNNQSFTKGTLSFNMKYVQGKTFPTGIDDLGTPATINNDFWIAETEVTYELWYAVRTWALSNGYTTENPGREGHDGDVTPPDGAAPTGADQEPATTINWRDSMVWCNALTEYYNANNGTDIDLDCVYYTDSTYTNPLHTSTDSSTITYLTPGTQDMPYIKSSLNGNTNIANCIAKGFRMIGRMDWELAARWRNDSTNTVFGYSSPWFTQGDSASGADADYNNAAATEAVAWYNTNSGSSTKPVKGKTANSLGIFDMSGNVYEWCFAWYTAGSTRTVRSGSWYTASPPMRIGVNYYSPTNNEDIYIGLRFARSAE